MAIRALLVDDNKDNLNVLSELLSFEGVEAVALLSPQAVDDLLAKDAAFDIIFLDLEMPQIDGYDLFHRFKSDARFADVPIIASTVHVSEMGVVRDMGFDGFIGKPLDADAFSEQLKRILGGKSVWVTP